MNYKGVQLHNPKFFIQNDTIFAVRFYIHNTKNTLNLNEKLNNTSNTTKSLNFNELGKTEIIINDWKKRNVFKQLYSIKLTMDKSNDQYNVTSFLKDRDGYCKLPIIRTTKK